MKREAKLMTFFCMQHFLWIRFYYSAVECTKYMQDAKSWKKATVNHWEYLFSPKMAVATLFL